MCVGCLALPGLVLDPGSNDIFPGDEPEPGLRLEPVGGTVTWTGCAGFLIEFDGVRICFDPFVSNPGIADVFLRAAKPNAELVRSLIGPADAVFVGHSHWDHAMDVAEVAKLGAVVHGSETTVELCRRQGIPESRLAAVTDGFTTTVGPFTISAIGSRHGIVPIFRHLDAPGLPKQGLPRAPIRWPMGEVFAYRVEVAGERGARSIHLHTSAGIEDAPLARQQPVDVLIACLAARQGTPDYFARLAEVLQPRVLVPCHHDNFLRPVQSAPKPVPRLDWPGFLGDVARMRERHGTDLVQLPRGVPVGF